MGLKEANLSTMSRDNAPPGAVWSSSSAHHIHENTETMALATERSRNEGRERVTLGSGKRLVPGPVPAQRGLFARVL